MASVSSSPKRAISLRMLALAFARLRRDDSGGIMIEMSVAFFTMILMLFAVIEACMMGYTYSLVMEGAKEGVRYACVHGTDAATCIGPSPGCDTTAQAVTNDVSSYISGLGANVSGMNVSTTYPDGVSTGTSRVQVTITYTYKPLFRISGVTYPTFAAVSSGRIMY